MAKKFTKEEFCAYRAREEIPCKPTFEIRKSMISTDGDPRLITRDPIILGDVPRTWENRKNALDIVKYTSPFIDPPEKYCDLFKIERTDTNGWLEKLTEEEWGLIYKIYGARYFDNTAIPNDEEKFKELLEKFNAFKDKPKWKLARILVESDEQTYFKQIHRRNELFNEGLEDLIVSGEVILSPGKFINLYQLRPRPDVLHSDNQRYEGNTYRYKGPIDYIGKGLACLMGKLNPTKNILDLLSNYCDPVNRIILDALYRDELKLHRDSGEIAVFTANNLKDGWLYWHEVRHILIARGISWVPVIEEPPSPWPQNVALIMTDNDANGSLDFLSRKSDHIDFISFEQLQDRWLKHGIKGLLPAQALDLADNGYFGVYIKKPLKTALPPIYIEDEIDKDWANQLGQRARSEATKELLKKHPSEVDDFMANFVAEHSYCLEISLNNLSKLYSICLNSSLNKRLLSEEIIYIDVTYCKYSYYRQGALVGGDLPKNLDLRHLRHGFRESSPLPSDDKIEENIIYTDLVNQKYKILWRKKIHEAYLPDEERFKESCPTYRANILELAEERGHLTLTLELNNLKKQILMHVLVNNITEQMQLDPILERFPLIFSIFLKHYEKQPKNVLEQFKADCKNNPQNIVNAISHFKQNPVALDDWIEHIARLIQENRKRLKRLNHFVEKHPLLLKSHTMYERLATLEEVEIEMACRQWSLNNCMGKKEKPTGFSSFGFFRDESNARAGYSIISNRYDASNLVSIESLRFNTEQLTQFQETPVFKEFVKKITGQYPQNVATVLQELMPQPVLKKELIKSQKDKKNEHMLNLIAHFIEHEKDKPSKILERIKNAHKDKDKKVIIILSVTTAHYDEKPCLTWSNPDIGKNIPMQYSTFNKYVQTAKKRKYLGEG